LKEANVDIKSRINSSNIKFWQVALQLGITDSMFSRKLRVELSEKEKARIYKIIEELAKEMEKDNE
jgi:hypothetical protein